MKISKGLRKYGRLVEQVEEYMTTRRNEIANAMSDIACFSTEMINKEKIRYIALTDLLGKRLMDSIRGEI